MLRAINPVIKNLPDDITDFKIIGSGYFSVCIELQSLHPLATKKTVRILSSQRSADEMQMVNEKKSLLKKQGVNVAQSYNIVTLPILKDPINKELRERLQSKRYTFINKKCGGFAIMYDEDYMPGDSLKVKSLADFALLDDIPQTHITKMVHDMMAIYQAGLDIDNAGDNLLYDKKTGFNFIDLDLTPYTLDTIPLHLSFEEITNHLAVFLGISVIQGIAFKQQIEDHTYIEEEVVGFVGLAEKCIIAVQQLENQYPQLKNNKKYHGWLYGMQKFIEELQQLLNTARLEDTI